MNTFTKAAATAMAVITLASSAASLAPSAVKKDTTAHVNCVVYGHECGRIRTTIYSDWIKTGSDEWFRGVYEEVYYVRTRSTACAYCGHAFSSSLEHRVDKYWWGDFSETKYY